MEFKLNEDQQLMKDMFVEFTEQFVKPIAAELDEQERFPEELIPQLGETGLLESRSLKSTAEQVQTICLTFLQ